MTKSPVFRVKFVASEGCPTTIIFEPSSMAYEFDENEFMFADVPLGDLAEIQVVYWNAVSRYGRPVR